MKIYTDIIQGTDEWRAIRCGKVSASRFSDVMAQGRGKSESKTRTTYLEQLRAEILTGVPEDSYTNSAMQWGTENEAAARQRYANESGNEIIPVGFVELNEWVGCSPDGLVCDDGLVEIKCPYSRTHLNYIENNCVPADYIKQIQGQLWVTGRQWCDFVSFDPRQKHEHLQYFCIRAVRDELIIQEIASAVAQFVVELNEMITRIIGEF